MGQAKLPKAPTDQPLTLKQKNAPTVYMMEKKLSTFVVIYCCLKHGKWWVLVILIGKITRTFGVVVVVLGAFLSFSRILGYFGHLWCIVVILAFLRWSQTSGTLQPLAHPL